MDELALGGLVTIHWNKIVAGIESSLAGLGAQQRETQIVAAIGGYAVSIRACYLTGQLLTSCEVIE